MGRCGTGFAKYGQGEYAHEMGAARQEVVSLLVKMHLQAGTPIGTVRAFDLGTRDDAVHREIRSFAGLTAACRLVDFHFVGHRQQIRGTREIL